MATSRAGRCRGRYAYRRRSFGPFGDTPPSTSAEDLRYCASDARGPGCSPARHLLSVIGPGADAVWWYAARSARDAAVRGAPGVEVAQVLGTRRAHGPGWFRLRPGRRRPCGSVIGVVAGAPGGVLIDEPGGGPGARGRRGGGARDARPGGGQPPPGGGGLGVR